MEMKVFYEAFSGFGIPQNINDYVHSSYTKVDVEYTDDNKVIIRVPLEEDRQITDFQEGVRNLLRDLKKNNGALAHKLARHYKFKL